MDIAILIHRLDEPRGAEQSQLTLARALTKRGHTVTVVGEKGELPPADDNVDYLNLDIPRDLYEGVGSWLDESLWILQICNHGWPVLRDISPDLVIAQHYTTFLAGCYTSRHRIPFVAFFHWKQRIGPHIPFGGDPKKLVRKVSKDPKRLVRELVNASGRTTMQFGYGRSDVSIATSHFARQQWGNSLPGPVEVVHPFIAENYELPRFGGEYVLHVTPNHQKGIDVTLKMAEMMPEERFLVVGWTPKGAIKRSMESLENVEYTGYVHDMRPIYRNAWAVVVPSSEKEAAGMVPVEAGLYGTPALVSGKGGLSEMAPDQLVLNTTDANPYVRRLRRMNDDYGYYCRLALEYAKAKTVRPQFDHFQEIVRTYCDIEL